MNPVNAPVNQAARAQKEIISVKPIVKYLLLLLSSLPLFCGCNQNWQETSIPAPKQFQEQWARRLASASFAESNNAFALDLYHQLRKGNDNLFFSPYSISTAIAMTYAGAKGRTEQQIAKALHFGLPQEKLHRTFAEHESQLNALGKTNGVQLSVANSLWPSKGLSLRKEYLQLIQRDYGSSIIPLDYSQPEPARQAINSWAEQRTENKIRDLIPAGLLGPDTVLVLANAIYFKGAWLTPFNPAQTQALPFFVTSAQQVSTPMMHEFRLRSRYHQNQEAQVLELPYKGDQLSMVVVLPKKVDGLETLESGLTPEKLKEWVSLLFEDEVDVWLPRLKLTAQFRLDETLKALGMVDAFGAADFTGMFQDRGPAISAVVHKAFVDVNEQGTEAAAATGVIVKVSLPTEFRADHPFIYYIQERKTGTILFLGRVVNPRSGG